LKGGAAVHGTRVSRRQYLDAVARVPFDRRVADGAELRRLLVDMAQRARSIAA